LNPRVRQAARPGQSALPCDPLNVGLQRNVAADQRYLSSMTDKQDPASLSPDEVPTPYGSAAGIESVTLVAAPLLAGGALALTGVVVQQEDSLALGPVPMVWQATAAMGRGDPCGPAGCRPHPDDQAHPAPQRGAGWVHHPRLSPRHPGRQPQVPGGPGRADTSSGRASFARWCRAARCAGAAPPPRVAAAFISTGTRTSCAQRGARR
jgi:hypothetical protein